MTELKMVENNPYMKRAKARQPTSHGKVSEKRVGKSLSARLTPASGALRGAKSDAMLRKSTYKFQIESKSTVNSSLPVEYGWLRKITAEAMASSSYPLLTFSFVDVDGKAKPQGDWVAMPLWLFQQLIEELGE